MKWFGKDLLLLLVCLITCCYSIQLSHDQCISLSSQCQSSAETHHYESGLPGKRGAPGREGEKGEPGEFDSGNTKFLKKKVIKLMEHVSRLEGRLSTTEEILQTTKDEAQTVQLQLTKTEQQLNDTATKLDNVKTKCANEIQNIQEQIDNLMKPKSCYDVTQINGTYTIQPNSKLPSLQVECLFNGATVITSVGHDSEQEEKVSKKCGQPKCSNKVINYQATFPQIRSLIQLLGNCRQFIKYRCYNSVLLRSGHAGWKTWDGRMQNYWGDANHRDGYCACGLGGNCADPTYKCNCDANDPHEREDGGYLTNEDDLPVHTIYFGDSDDRYETTYGYYTLGRLECMG